MSKLRSKIKEQHAVAAVYVISLFMASMDGQIVNVALADAGSAVSRADVICAVGRHWISAQSCGLHPGFRVVR